jgi:hypothetical protein
VDEELFLENASSAGSQEVLQLLNRADSLPRSAAAPGKQPEASAAAAAAGAAKGFRFTMFGKEGSGGGAGGGEGQVRGCCALLRRRCCLSSHLQKPARLHPLLLTRIPVPPIHPAGRRLVPQTRWLGQQRRLLPQQRLQPGRLQVLCVWRRRQQCRQGRRQQQGRRAR